VVASWELVTLAFLALLIFGPERLPGMARTAGRMINKLRQEAGATVEELKQATEYEELRKSAQVDELKQLSEDLRAEAADIGKEASGAIRQAELGAGPSAAVREDMPAPFDPDAT
jgi:sec-independent protein translocase protein TatB